MVLASANEHSLGYSSNDYMDHRLSLVGSLYDSNLFWEEKFSYMNVTHDLPGHLTGRKIHPGLF